MKKNTLIIFVVIILLALAYLATKYFQPEKLQIAEVTTGGVVNLSLSSSNLSVSPGGTTSLDLNIAVDGTNKTTGVAVELAYDPTYLQITSVTKGDFFSNALSAAQFGSGKIAFTYAVDPASGGRSGSGKVAVIAFKLLKSGTTNLSFHNNSIATATNFDGNVLKSVSSASISGRGRADIYPANGDGTVNLLDYTQLVTDWGKSGAAGFIPSDIKADGVINLLDYTTLVTDWGKTY